MSIKRTLTLFALLACLAFAGTVSADSAPTNDNNWRNGFAAPNLPDGAPGTEIYAVAEDTNGNLYIGGDFNRIGDIVANNIAMWDGAQWHRLGNSASTNGNGITGTVREIFIDENNSVWVAGAFNRASNDNGDHVDSTGLVRWDGVQWNAVGGGANGTVYAIAKHANDLYIGGDFAQVTQSDGATLTANNVARWSETDQSWHTLGAADGNGTSQAFGDLVRALAVDTASGSLRLYIGGDFSSVHDSATVSHPANNIAAWDGTAWSLLGDNNDNGTNNLVLGLAVDSAGTVYSGGSFTIVNKNNSGSTLNEITALRAAAWHSSTGWQPLEDGFNNSVNVVQIDDNSDIYFGGSFQFNGGDRINYLARWNGTTWEPVGDTQSPTGNGLNAAVSDISRERHVAFIANLAYSSEDSALGANGLAQFNGTTGDWQAVGLSTAGSAETIRAIAQHPVTGDWYVGGDFDTIGTIAANNIARWDGTAWHPLGGDGALQNGVNASVRALLFDGSDLYIGGSFSEAYQSDGTELTANRVAKWEGAAWEAVGVGTFGTVYALTKNGDDLYVGGNFFATANSLPNTQHLAKATWNGAAWTWSSITPDGSPNLPVNTLAHNGSQLVAGGAFTTLNGINFKRIARFDGVDWYSLANLGLNGTVNALQFAPTGELYAAGSFTTFYGSTTDSFLRVGKYNAALSNMSSVGGWSGNGVNGVANAISISADSRYVTFAGQFSQVLETDFTGSDLAVTNITTYDTVEDEWFTRGDGLNATALALAEDATQLWAGGTFSQAGDHFSDHIAIWEQQQFADLTVRQFADRAHLPAQVDQDVTVFIEVTNNGPFSTTNVIISDTLPATVNGVSFSSGDCTNTPTHLTCTIPQLFAGETITRIVGLRPLESGQMVNTVRVSSDRDEPTPADNISVLDLFTQPAPGTLYGYAFDDRNGNGVREAGEPPRPSVTLEFSEDGGTIYETVQTDANGYYTVALPQTATWYNVAPLTGGFVQTAPQVDRVPLSSGGYVRVDFGLAEPVVSGGRVAGSVWLDGNGNGLFEDVESPLPGHLVSLLKNGVTLSTTVTDNNGLYIFDGVIGGAYTVQTEAPDGYAPDPGTASVVAIDGVIANGSLPFAPVGDVRVEFVLSGYASYAAAYNLPISVTLEQPAGTVISETVVLPSLYRYFTTFADLPPGDYVVRTVLPPFDRFDLAVVGLNPQPVTLQPDGTAQVEVLVGDVGSAEIPILYGYAPPRYRRFSYLWEPQPLGGISVQITGTLGYSATMTSDAEGRIIFDSLPRDTYSVRVLTDSLPPRTSVRNGSYTRYMGGQTTTMLPPMWVVADSGLFTYCATTDGIPFPCDVTVIDGATGAVAATKSDADGGRNGFLNLPTGNYEVVITPQPAANLTAQPPYTATVFLPSFGSVNVAYPFALTENATTVAGTVWYDRNRDGILNERLRYRRVCDANGCGYRSFPRPVELPAVGIAVQLTHSSGAVFSTVTDAAGAYAFRDVAVGSYSVDVVLPAGTVQTVGGAVPVEIDLARAVDSADFPILKTDIHAVTGRVIHDDDRDGVYLPQFDRPLGGLIVELHNPAGLIATTGSSGDGSFSFESLVPGNYRVRAYYASVPNEVTEVKASTGGAGSYPSDVLIDVMPRLNAPRVVVFADDDGDGAPDPNEQRLENVTVRLLGRACWQDDGGGNAKQTNANGFIQYRNVSANRICLIGDDSSLPDTMRFADANGVSAAAGSNAVVWLPVERLGYLRVIAFLDVNGNGTRENGERSLFWARPTVSANANGATIVRELGRGRYIVTEGRYFLSGSLSDDRYAYGAYCSFDCERYSHMPTIAADEVRVIRVPVRYRGGISGQLTNVLGQSQAIGNVQLIFRNYSGTGAATITTQTDAQGNFRLENLATGAYRLRFATDAEGNSLDIRSVSVAHVAGVTTRLDAVVFENGVAQGFVFWDADEDGFFDSAETGIQNTAVTISEWRQPAFGSTLSNSNGGWLWRFADNTTGRYTARVQLPDNDLQFTNSRRDTFSARSGTTHNVGLAVRNNGSLSLRFYLLDSDLVFDDSGYLEDVRVILRNCADNALLAVRYSDVGGNIRYEFPDTLPLDAEVCVRWFEGATLQPPIRVPVTNLDPATGARLPNRFFREITIVDTAAEDNYRLANLMTHARVTAFVDGNGNGVRDVGEPPLAGVAFGDGVTRVDGSAWVTVTQAVETIAVNPPVGYAPNFAVPLTVLSSGELVSLPPLGFVVEGGVFGRIHHDLDGDNRPHSDETGIGTITVTVTGATVVSTTVADADGHFTFLDLPDGDYTVSFTVPTGIAPINDQTITVANNSATLTAAAREAGVLSGVIYDNWDGDGQRGVDEPLNRSTITVTVDGVTSVAAAGGQFALLDVPAGAQTVRSTWAALEPVQTTMSANDGTGLALGGVPGGTIRGTAWLDANRDGVRQVDEISLAGYTVTLANGNRAMQTTTTDIVGRFTFAEQATGSYSVTFAAPMGYETTVENVTINAQRGGAVGFDVVLTLPTAVTLSQQSAQIPAAFAAAVMLLLFATTMWVIVADRKQMFGKSGGEGGAESGAGATGG